MGSKRATQQVPEEQLLKALADMEALAKGDNGTSGMGNKTPTTTAQANGGLSDEGDKKELAVTSKSPSYSAKSVREDEDEEPVEKKSLAEWAQEDEDEAVKGDDEDESEGDSEDESMEDEDEESETMTKKGKTCKSSIADLMKSDSAAGPVIDALPIMESFVDQISDADMELRKAVMDLGGSVHAQNRVLKSMAKVVLQTHALVKGLGEMPAGERKTVLHKSEIQERFLEPTPQLSKAEVLDIMIDLAQSGKVTPIDVTRYEVTNSMEPSVRKAVEDRINVLQKSA